MSGGKHAADGPAARSGAALPAALHSAGAEFGPAGLGGKAPSRSGSAVSPREACLGPTGPLFGPAGRAESFTAMGYRHMWQVPEYLAGFGLMAFEYQAGHGVRLKADTAEKMVAAAAEHGVRYSIHAPYYISTSGLDEEKRLNSLNYLLQSARAVRMLGGSRVIFHCGGTSGQTRQQAMEKTADTIALARRLLDEEGLEEINLCPETMGRHTQLGTLEEVLALCREDARHIPCLDFGHLNARQGGGLTKPEHYAAMHDAMVAALGPARAAAFHVHFSKIEYTAAGEKRHLTFEDTTFGPPFEPFIQLCAARGLAPTVICESAGTQTEDAAVMQKYYKKCIRKNKYKEETQPC